MAELRQPPRRGLAAAMLWLWTDLVLPVGPAIYALIMFAIGDLRPEHIVIAALAAGFGFASRKTKAILVAAGPALLVLLGYDVMRYIRPIFVTPDRVVSCAVRDIDLRLFGVGPDTTLSDYFAAHHAIALDLYFAIPYAIFFVITIVYCLYLYFKDRPRLDHYLWSFALIHAMAFTVWVILPVAPPWYIRVHGCTILSSVLPSAAGLARVDQYLGIHYFQDFYGRAPDVFGAMPSLHCAFPAIGLFTAWCVATWRTWPLHLLYLFSMFAASIYLGHHWTLDGLGGWLMAAVAVLIVGLIMRSRDGRVAAR